MSQPVAKFQFGRFSLAVWEEQKKNDDGKEYTSVSASLSCPVGDGKYKSIPVGNATDVLCLQALLDKFRDYRYEKGDPAANEAPI